LLLGTVVFRWQLNAPTLSTGFKVLLCVLGLAENICLVAVRSKSGACSQTCGSNTSQKRLPAAGGGSDSDSALAEEEETIDGSSNSCEGHKCPAVNSRTLALDNNLLNTCARALSWLA